MNETRFTRRDFIRGAAALGLVGPGSGVFSSRVTRHEVNLQDVIDIGSRRELFVDEALIERISGHAQQRMHHPIPREVALVHDEPWEGTGSGYHSVFQDGEIYRMYYK